MRAALKRVTITFTREGIEYAVAYEHSEAHEPANPGSKKRSATAARMARKALEAALEGLSKGPVVWAGFGTNTRESDDRIIIDREDAAA